MDSNHQLVLKKYNILRHFSEILTKEFHQFYNRTIDICATQTSSILSYEPQLIEAYSGFLNIFMEKYIECLKSYTNPNYTPYATASTHEFFSQGISNAYIYAKALQVQRQQANTIAERRVSNMRYTRSPAFQTLPSRQFTQTIHALPIQVMPKRPLIFLKVEPILKKLEGFILDLKKKTDHRTVESINDETLKEVLTHMTSLYHFLAIHDKEQYRACLNSYITHQIVDKKSIALRKPLPSKRSNESPLPHKAKRACSNIETVNAIQRLQR